MLGQVEILYLLRDLETCPSGLPLQAKQTPGLFTFGLFQLFNERSPNLESFLVMLSDIADALEGPAHILFSLVFLERDLGLFRERDRFANGHPPGGQVFSDLDQPFDRDRRTRDSLLGFDLSTLDPLCDRDFAFASQQRDDTHFAEIEPDRIVRFVERAGGKVEVEIVLFNLLFLIVDRYRRRPVKQGGIVLGDWNI